MVVWDFYTINIIVITNLLSINGYTETPKMKILTYHLFAIDSGTNPKIKVPDIFLFLHKAGPTKKNKTKRSSMYMSSFQVLILVMDNIFIELYMCYIYILHLRETSNLSRHYMGQGNGIFSVNDFNTYLVFIFIECDKVLVVFVVPHLVKRKPVFFFKHFFLFHLHGVGYKFKNTETSYLAS